jgi:5-methylthioadenosine/S-adenosylhomocysteine deaminase
MNTKRQSAPPRGPRFLLRGASVVTVDDQIGDLHGDILVANGKIEAVRPHIDAGDTEIVDASSFIVIPGFVDPHRHLWQLPVRHIGVDWDLERIFVEIWQKIGPRFRPEDAYATSLYGRLVGLDSGVTTLLDWSNIQNSPDHSDENVRGLREAGGRSIFGHGQPGNDRKKWMDESPLDHPADIRRVRRDVLPSNNGPVTLALGMRGPEFSTIDAVARDVALARELDIRITTHVGLGPSGPKYRSIERMHQRNLLGCDVTCLHCCTSSDHEIQLLADTGTTVSVSAQMETVSGGFGLPPTGRMLEHGIRPSLSIDSEICANGDMFTEMRAALGAERAIRNNEIQPRPKSKQVSARDVLSFATIEGARSLGLEAKTGSISPGKFADLVLLRADAPNLAPVGDPVASVVLGAHSGNIAAVFVEGRPVKWEGQLLADLARPRALIERSREFLCRPLVATTAV